MKAVDPLRVRELLGYISDALHRLQELRALPQQDFVADYRCTESAKYLLIVATEAAIDLCNHLVACQGARAPQDYADCFTILAELGVIQAELASRLRMMARFRNRLVHLYWQIDNTHIYRILHENLSDLDAFRQQIISWLEHQKLL